MDKLWQELTGTRFHFVQIAAYEDWIGNHKREAKKLVKTFLEAAEFVKNNPDLIEKHKDLLDIQTRGEISLMKERLPGLFPTEWNKTSLGNIDTLIKKAVGAGIISKMPEEPVTLLLD